MSQVSLSYHCISSFLLLPHFLARTSLRSDTKLTDRRKVAAMGGMSAQIPIKNDPAKNDTAMNKVRADKEREVTAGHDGTWVAHPALIKIAMDAFDEHMKGPNQVSICSFFILHILSEKSARTDGSTMLEERMWSLRINNLQTREYQERSQSRE